MSDVLVPAVPAHVHVRPGALSGAGATARAWSRRAAPWIAVAAVALLARPYLGLHHDARIYVGRAVANLDPAGVGRDLMYAGDGQSGFSLFPRALTWLTAALGPAGACAATTLAALACWTLAAGVFLGPWAGRARRLPVLAAALILPCGYAGTVFAYGEAMAAPRPFAEALALCALASELCGRRWAAAALMLAASAIHPIMALPGWGVLLALRVWEDRRWLLPCAAVALLAAAGAGLHAPVLGRLAQPVDAAWMRVLLMRDPYLFLDHWPLEAWGRTLVQVCTLAVGARHLPARGRRMALAVIVVAAGALVATAAAVDGGHSLLAVQVQPWRALWLLAFLSAASAPLAAGGLWRRGAVGRTGAAALLLAWMSLDLPASAACACALLIACEAVAGRESPRARRLLAATGALLAGVAILYGGVQADAAWVQWAAAPAGARPSLHVLALLDVFRAMLAAGVLAAVGASGTSRARWAPAAAAAALMAGLALWDARAPSQRTLDDPVAAAQVRSIAGRRPGPVEWLGGDVEPTLLAGRPAWRSGLQGAGAVFSRPQALEWMRRTHRLVQTGVAAPSLEDGFYDLAPEPLWTPGAAALDRFCGDADAPAWIVFPLAAGAARPPLAEAVWTAPRPVAFARFGGGAMRLADRYAFVPCRGRSA